MQTLGLEIAVGAGWFPPVWTEGQHTHLQPQMTCHTAAVIKPTAQFGGGGVTQQLIHNKTYTFPQVTSTLQAAQGHDSQSSLGQKYQVS